MRMSRNATEPCRWAADDVELYADVPQATKTHMSSILSWVATGHPVVTHGFGAVEFPAASAGGMINGLFQSAVVGSS